MITKVKLLMAAVFAMAALSGLMVDNASAEWLINGSPLGAGKSAALGSFSSDVSPILHFSAGAVSVLILCGGLFFSGRIAPKDLGFLEKITFYNCHTISPTPTNCQLVGLQTTLTSIATGPVLALAKSSTRLSAKPETGKVFAEIPFDEGSTCVLEGSVPAKGEVVLATPTGGEEQAHQAIEGLGSQENNSLEIGSGNKGFLLGKVLVCLAGQSKWSYK